MEKNVLWPLIGKEKRSKSMRGSTGSFWGDLAAYAIAGAILWVLAIIWQIITGGGKDKDKN